MVQTAVPDSGGIEPLPSEDSPSENDSSGSLEKKFLQYIAHGLQQSSKSKKQSKRDRTDIIGEKDWYALSSLDDIELAQKILALVSQSTLIDARKRYGKWAFVLVVIWLAIVLLIVVVSGMEFAPANSAGGGIVINGFSLSDTVLVTLVSTTTANLLGLLVIVYNFVFSDKH